MMNTEQKKDLGSGKDNRAIPTETVDMSPVTTVTTDIVGDKKQGDGKGWKWDTDTPGQNGN